MIRRPLLFPFASLGACLALAAGCRGTPRTDVPTLPAPAAVAAFTPTVPTEVIVLSSDPERPVRVLGPVVVTVDSGTAPRVVSRRLTEEAAKLGAQAIALIDSRDTTRPPRWVRVDDYVPTLPVVRGTVTVQALALRLDL
jgi:hypothetical protein